MKQRQPRLWAAFAELAKQHSYAEPYKDIIVAVDALPSPGMYGVDVSL